MTSLLLANVKLFYSHLTHFFVSFENRNKILSLIVRKFKRDATLEAGCNPNSQVLLADHCSTQVINREHDTQAG